MSFKHHIFVDFENVREADIDLLEGQSASITLVLGKQQKTLPLSMVEALRRLPPAQATLVQSAVPGKNALDFVLACLVGRVIEREPGVSVHIVSKDKGFDALIAHLKERGIQATRHESLPAVAVLGAKFIASAPAKPMAVAGSAAAKPIPPKKTPADKPVPPLDVRVDCLANRLAKNKSAGPQKRSTLVTYIKNQLAVKMSDRQIKETIDGLSKRGVLSIASDGKVVYAQSGKAGDQLAETLAAENVVVPF